ncbi:MAG: hypothetical protein IJH34_03125 [Romboutsia sp.]|nr:hypothetical protein [Romboutsia sp.]
MIHKEKGKVMDSIILKKEKGMILCFFMLLSCIVIINISNQLGSYLNDTNELFGMQIMAKILLKICLIAYIFLIGITSIIGEALICICIAYESIKSKKYKNIIFLIIIMFLFGILTYAYIIQIYPFQSIIKEIIVLIITVIFIALLFGVLYSL